MALRSRDLAADGRQTIAVFDFDGTLTTRDSFLPFIYSTVGLRCFLMGVIAISPILLGYLLKIVPNWKAKEITITHFFKGWTLKRFEAAGSSFASAGLPGLLKPVALDRLHWHLQEGHRVILLSASLEVYLKPWAAIASIHHVLATRLQIVDGKLTGRLEGDNCYGPEKLHRLHDFLGDRRQYLIYAYGDSRGDNELLHDADIGFFRKFSP